MSMIDIEFSNPQTRHSVDQERLTAAVRLILQDQHIQRATVSVAVVDDPTIHALNRRYLQHDYATDVLSFLLEDDAERMEGEILVSADTAAASCRRFGWTLNDELLLYVVHGMLHLIGYDDHSAEDRAEMREREQHYLASFGVEARYDETDVTADSHDENYRSGLSPGLDQETS